MKTLLVTLALGTLSLAQAAEMRVWTSRKGSTIEAKLSRVSDGKAVLVTADPKEITVPVKDLSLADRQHLVEYADQPKDILTGIEMGVPEEDVRIDKGQFKKLEEQLVFDEDTELMFDLMESDHFLIATAGKTRPNAVAEMAERLWHGMAFQHMNFREDWGDKRMVIFIVDDEDTHEELGKWYVRYLEGRGLEGDAARIAQTWERSSGSAISLSNDMQETYNVFARSRVFHVREGTERGYKKVFGPFPTNCLAKSLLNKQLGGVSNISPKGYFAITTGHAYYKEILLADRSETTLLDASDYDSDEIANARGFQDGTSWAKTLRKMVRGDKVQLDFEKMLTWDVSQLTPERLVTIYSFAYYMNSTPERVSAFAEMVRRIESNKQVPETIEIAKIFGFESVEELQNDWIEFVKSTKFK
ncbi:MAG: SHD1 domain-containing protein [Verrucomicrobiota bacterium JB023]|nr:SHD1 domain-containing protein [Verrucomicrobiota bacterium JB023]